MDFVALLKDFGFPVFCVIVGGFGVYRIALAFVLRVCLPVAERHIKFLDELAVAMSLQSQAMQTMAIQMGKVVTETERVSTNLTKVVEESERVGENLTKVVAESEHAGESLAKAGVNLTQAGSNLTKMIDENLKLHTEIAALLRKASSGAV